MNRGYTAARFRPVETHSLTLLAAAEGLSPSQITRLLLALAALLGLARLLGEFARELKQPAVLGEILAGVLLGPTVFEAIAPGAYAWLFPPDGLLRAAEDGFILLSATLLLLAVGLDVDLSTVWRQGKTMALVSALGIALPMTLGGAMGLTLPDVLGMGERGGQAPVAFAVFVGIALSITALPVIAKVLMDLNLAKSDLGLLIISSAMLNDLVGWIGFAVVLALLPQTMTDGGGSAATHTVATTITLTLLFLGLMITVGRLAAHRVMPWVQAHWSWPGGVLSFVFVVAMVCAAFTEWLGVHSIFGAFIAGVAIGDSHHLTERTRDTIHQFVTNIFAPIFFASIGLRIDFVDAFDPLAVAIVLGVAVTGKLTGCYLGAKLGKLSTRESWAVAFGMTCQGAVGIILGQLAYDAGLITESLLVAIVIMALVTSLMSGPAMQRILNTKSKLRLIDLLTERHVVMQPKATTVDEIIDELSERASDLADLEHDRVRDLVIQRERLMHTGLPGGLAVPHARVTDLAKPIMIVGRSERGIDFDARDGAPARLICLILTPEDEPQAQIELLATVSETFADPSIRQRAVHSKTATEFRAALNLAANKPSEELTPKDDAVV